jgi:hypothetical protein
VTNKYTCNEYRQEMRLVGLKRQLEGGELSEIEKRTVESEIKRLEKEMEMD